MLDVLVGFVAELRRAGLPVSVSEEADAAEALAHLPLEDRQAVKFALGATLVKSANHWRAFDTAFEVYFSMRGPQFSPLGEDRGALDKSVEPDELDENLSSGAESGGEPVTAEEMTAMLLRALRAGDRALLSAIARLAVARYAAMEPGRPVGGTYYLYRTLRNLNLEGVLTQLIDEARAEAAGGALCLTALEERLLADEYNARIAQLTEQIEAEIRRRLVADRGAEVLARSLRKPLPEDIEFMHATREELVAMRKAIAPLTRKLATRLSRKRRHLHRGSLDFRSTMRHSLSYGGVPVEPRYKHPHQTKPEIWVIADVSGSVAAFARFTLQLVHAIASQFSRVRSFVFIDGIDEVTGIFERCETVSEAIAKVNLEADVVWADGHSDYGHALSVFFERWGDEIGPKASILVLGDARNNYHASQAWVLREIQHRARRVFWLNPEPRAYWGSGDSILEQYAQHCDAAYECRNLRQLEAFVEHLS
ncbi:MAG: VWA domain-containing protein [Acidimicrobiales bacterium]|jgi:uncharacterized protein with von Willebrand factor type A (vWA) domain